MNPDGGASSAPAGDVGGCSRASARWSDKAATAGAPRQRPVVIAAERLAPCVNEVAAFNPTAACGARWLPRLHAPDMHRLAIIDGKRVLGNGAATGTAPQVFRMPVPPERFDPRFPDCQATMCTDFQLRHHMGQRQVVGAGQRRPRRLPNNDAPLARVGLQRWAPHLPLELTRGEHSCIRAILGSVPRRRSSVCPGSTEVVCRPSSHDAMRSSPRSAEMPCTCIHKHDDPPGRCWRFDVGSAERWMRTGHSVTSLMSDPLRTSSPDYLPPTRAGNVLSHWQPRRVHVNTISSWRDGCYLDSGTCVVSW